MLATGIKSPVGIKVNGNNLAEIEKTAEEIERIVRSVPGVTSALAERLDGGPLYRYRYRPGESRPLRACR
ncbi:Cobalt-zinc-cadmium resistance protein CzcA, Cation efflux system protein CusA [Klebsiella michiganensis]|nr:Cobalt-zinc-cadmium resistance protein CzcA, Cation efflux system protein CusA [Klebsiella michiganensis]